MVDPTGLDIALVGEGGGLTDDSDKARGDE
jgi:hypothetical protein